MDGDTGWNLFIYYLFYDCVFIINIYYPFLFIFIFIFEIGAKGPMKRSVSCRL